MAEDIVLGIIGCPIMEDEIVHVVNGDPTVDRVLIIETEDSAGLVRKLRALPQGLKVNVLAPEDVPAVKAEGFTLMVAMKPMALHEDPQRLRQEVTATAHSMSQVCHSLLLFYGLCGNAFRDVHSLSQEVGRPITLVHDHAGRPVDDCIAAVVGGTEGYLRLLKRYPGVFYLTPAWAENWRSLMNKMEITKGIDGDDLATIKWMFEMAGYKLVLKIPTGLGDQDGFDQRIDEFAHVFGFSRGELEREMVSLDCVERSYQKAKGDRS